MLVTLKINPFCPPFYPFFVTCTATSQCWLPLKLTLSVHQFTRSSSPAQRYLGAGYHVKTNQPCLPTGKKRACGTVKWTRTLSTTLSYLGRRTGRAAHNRWDTFHLRSSPFRHRPGTLLPPRVPAERESERRYVYSLRHYRTFTELTAPSGFSPPEPGADGDGDGAVVSADQRSFKGISFPRLQVRLSIARLLSYEHPPSTGVHPCCTRRVLESVAIRQRLPTTTA